MLLKGLVWTEGARPQLFVWKHDKVQEITIRYGSKSSFIKQMKLKYIVKKKDPNMVVTLQTG